MGGVHRDTFQERMGVRGSFDSPDNRTSQVVHKIIIHYFGAPLPPLPTSKVMDFHLNLYEKNLKQNCGHSTKIANKLSQNCEQAEL